MVKGSSRKNQNLTAIKFRNFMKNNGIFIFGLLFIVLLAGLIMLLNSNKEEKTLQIYGDDVIEMHYFYLSTCPHCHEQEKFHPTLLSKYPNLRINEYEMTKSGSLEKYQEMAQNYAELDSNSFPGTPLTIIGSRVNIGFGSAETTGQTLLDMVEEEQQRIMSEWNDSMKTTQQLREELNENE